MAQLLTVDEVARRASAHPNTVRNWIRRGELASVKIGQLRRIRADDLERFIAEHIDSSAGAGA